ncbi:AAA family ATPase [Pseudomonas sp. SWRI179]|uniref:AAA family ATPase n=1 Tax=Pseudomonas sp. SWRI179 TaxID=2745497 RepID=UPI001647AF41|nr:AAA family ATPase [Pseudomonas sp. SWRI179]MBC3385678.1 ATP-binding protein [Pseudomonas sp. SWRI179]
MEHLNATKVLNVVSINAEGGAKKVEIKSGCPIFILGRNGTGKSALVGTLSTKLGQNLVFMPGSRPSYFDRESLNLTPASRRDLAVNLTHWNADPDTRWKATSGTARNEKAIHDLQSAELQYKLDAANEIKAEGAQSSAIARLQSNNAPLDRINALLSQSNLQVRVLISGGELKAQRGDAVYSIARMSDGERAALIFAAEVVAAPDGAIFLIDEPELHLHPAIVVPLLKALIAERPKCGFVICTHELELPGNSFESKIILVRGCKWSGTVVESWQVDVLDAPEEIPEWLRVDLIGSRQKILFIEGTTSSLDHPLYSLLFPKVSVRSRESCREVMRAVEGLRAVEKMHRAQAFGLIDHDGMDEKQMLDFESHGIYPLPIFAVESLYYSTEVLAGLAAQQAKMLGLPVELLQHEAQIAALQAVTAKGISEHLASRISERYIRDQLLLALPDRKMMIEGAKNHIEFKLESPYPLELERIEQMINAQDIDAIVCRYPVRESGMLNGIAKALHFNGRTDYERAALILIGTNDELQQLLKLKLGKLSEMLV